MKSILRRSIATLSRQLPSFRGKARLGVQVGRALTNAACDKDCIDTITMRDGTRMQIDVRSRTEQWTYWTGEYDAAIISRITSSLSRDCMVFDVGANVGFYSVALGNKLRNLDGRLLAFEPVLSNFERLTACIRLNELQETVSAYNIAVGDEDGVIDLHMEHQGNASTGNAVIVRGKVGTEDKLAANATARITRLDTFVQENKVEKCNFIKIDVEGAEVMFLRGGSRFLSATRPIIYGEFNPYWLKQFGHSFEDVVAIVDPWNYRFFKQVGVSAFSEVDQPEAGLADMLLCPSETQSSVLRGLGVDL